MKVFLGAVTIDTNVSIREISAAGCKRARRGLSGARSGPNIIPAVLFVSEFHTGTSCVEIFNPVYHL